MYQYSLENIVNFPSKISYTGTVELYEYLFCNSNIVMTKVKYLLYMVKVKIAILK